MAKNNIQTPAGFTIASQQIKQEEARDLMAPGSGTPWEDRGASNVFFAFFKTAKMSLTSPVALFHSIRRPETTNDATGFVIACGITFGLSWFGHSMAMIPHLENRPPEQMPLINTTLYVISSAIQFLIMPFATVGLLKLIVRLVGKITATELNGKASSVLIYNVLAYALGPSVLALIPVVGPPIALFWIFILMCIAGTRRLQVSKSGTIVAMILSWLAGSLLTTAIFFAGWFLWKQVAADEYAEPPDTTVQHAGG